MPTVFEPANEGIVFTVTVQPRASKNAVMGRHGDTLKIKLTAPPVDGAANKACITFLAKQLGVAKSRLEIVSGHNGRVKRVRCRYGDGHDKRTLSAALDALYSD